MKGNSVKLLYNNLVTNSKESGYKIYKIQTNDNISQVNFKGGQGTKIQNETLTNSNSNNPSNDLIKSKFNQIITQVSPSMQQNNLAISNSNGDLIEEMQNDDNFWIEIEKQRMRPKFLPPQLEKHKGMKTLFVDLDETLVHSSFVPLSNPDYVLPVEIEGKIFEIYVLKRPGIKEFLGTLRQYFEVVIYTASLSKYANPLLDLLDYEKNATYRLFREQCVFNNITNGFVKDLESAGRELKDIIIVDNSPGAYLLQPENGIPIQTWIDDPEDNSLIQLIPLLEFLSKVDDVRIFIKKIVKNNSLNIAQALNFLKREFKISNNNSINCLSCQNCQNCQNNKNCKTCKNCSSMQNCKNCKNCNNCKNFNLNSINNSNSNNNNNNYNFNLNSNLNLSKNTKKEKEKPIEQKQSNLSEKISNKIRSEETKEKYNVSKLLHESKEGLNLMYSNLTNPSHLDKKTNNCLMDLNSFSNSNLNSKTKIKNEAKQSKVQSHFMQNLIQPNTTKNLLNLFNNVNPNSVKSKGTKIDKVIYSNLNNNEKMEKSGTNNKYNLIQSDEFKSQGFSPKFSKKANTQNTPIKNKTKSKNFEPLISQSYSNNQVNDSLNNLFIQNNNGMSAYERYKQKALKNGSSHHISTSKGPFKLRYDQNDEIINATSKKPGSLIAHNKEVANQKRINSSHSSSKKGDSDFEHARVNSSSHKLQTPRKNTEKKRYNSTSKIIQSSNNKTNKKTKETPTKLKKQNPNYTERSNIEYSSIGSNNLLQPKTIMSEIKRISSKHLGYKEDKIGNQSGMGSSFKWFNFGSIKNIELDKMLMKH